MSKQRSGRALIKGGTIVTMDPKVPNLSTGDVQADGGRSAAVGMNLQADGAEVIDASGSISLLDIAYGLSDPAAGVIASRFDYATSIFSVPSARSLALHS